MRQPSPSKSVFFRYLSVVVFEPHGVYSDFLRPAHILLAVVYKQTLLGFQPYLLRIYSYILLSGLMMCRLHETTTPSKKSIS